MALEIHPPLTARSERQGKGTLWTYAPIVCTPMMDAPHLSPAQKSAETRMVRHRVRLLRALGPHKTSGRMQFLALIAGLPIDRLIRRAGDGDEVGVLVATRRGSILMLYPHHKPFMASVIYEAEMLGMLVVKRPEPVAVPLLLPASGL